MSVYIDSQPLIAKFDDQQLIGKLDNRQLLARFEDWMSQFDPEANRRIRQFSTAC